MCCRGPVAGERDRAAMCETCPHATRGPTRYGRGAVQCGIDAKPIGRYVAGFAPCPRGRHPDGHGVVRWLGLVWIGVPAPIRLWLWAMHPKHPHPSGFQGCGCLKIIKSALMPGVRAADRA